jgi:hypothetical protein
MSACVDPDLPAGACSVHVVSRPIALRCVLLLQLYQQEQLARQAAEASEAKALAAAGEHAQLFEALLAETQRSSATSQRRARLASVNPAVPTQRPHTAAGAGAGPSQSSSSVNAVDKPEAGQQRSTPVAEQSSGKHPLSVSTDFGATGSKDSAMGLQAGSELVQQRARCHRQLQQGLAAERRALAEVAVNQRRAAAAAELEESRRVRHMRLCLKQLRIMSCSLCVPGVYGHPTCDGDMLSAL